MATAHAPLPASLTPARIERLAACVSAVPASACTMTLPVISGPAPPSARRRYGPSSSALGNWPSAAVFSSTAALAIRLRSICPERRDNGENSSLVILLSPLDLHRLQCVQRSH